MKKQIYNPYLPLDEYVPDAEPHVFDGRVYVYGSHDREDGETFCMLDYVCYSAPVEDLRSWRFEGVIYRAAQDPDYRKKDSVYSPVGPAGADGPFCRRGPSSLPDLSGRRGRQHAGDCLSLGIPGP